MSREVAWADVRAAGLADIRKHEGLSDLLQRAAWQAQRKTGSLLCNVATGDGW